MKNVEVHSGDYLGINVEFSPQRETISPGAQKLARGETQENSKAKLSLSLSPEIVQKREASNATTRTDNIIYLCVYMLAHKRSSSIIPQALSLVSLCIVLEPLQRIRIQRRTRVYIYIYIYLGDR